MRASPLRRAVSPVRIGGVTGAGQARCAAEPNVESQANTEVVTALLSQGPTCVRCIARECGLSLAAAETVLTVIQRAFEVLRRETAECRECGHFVVVFSLRR